MLSFFTEFLASTSNSCFGNLFKCHRRSTSSKHPDKITRNWMRRNDSLASIKIKSSSLCSPCCPSICINQNNMSNSNDNQQEQFNFTLSTYNILAPNLANEHRYLYSNVDNRYLCWNYRKKKILDEIKQLNSDVIID